MKAVDRNEVLHAKHEVDRRAWPTWGKRQEDQVRRVRAVAPERLASPAAVLIAEEAAAKERRHLSERLALLMHVALGRISRRSWSHRCRRSERIPPKS
jgi:hypothetical protein